MHHDSAGYFGTVMLYSMLIALFGSTLLVFLYLWRRGRLDMDEDAKYRMMDDDKEEKGNGGS